MRKSIILILLSIAALSCEDGSIFPASSDMATPNVSKGGSTARFAIKGDYLYIVDDQNLNIFDTSDQNESVLISSITIGWGVETIFPYGDLLFLGTMSGMLIFDISSPTVPLFLSDYSHIVACDPVVTDGAYAYLTIRAGTNCGRPVNELHIIDLADIARPKVINVVPMTNPKGLAINGNTLYVCDDGIKVFDVTNREDIQELDYIENIPANDVIYNQNQLLVTADNGFYQFNTSDFTQLSYFAY